jgi:hypothetical protein
MDTYSIVMAETSLPDTVMKFKVHMKLLMDGGDKEDMIKNIETHLGVSATSEHKDFAEKVKQLPFSLKEKYKILYCAIKEQNLNVTKIVSISIQQWKKDNGYGHLDCSHLYKTEDAEATKSIREIIYILHNISLE